MAEAIFKHRYQRHLLDRAGSIQLVLAIQIIFYLPDRRTHENAFYVMQIK